MTRSAGSTTRRASPRSRSLRCDRASTRNRRTPFSTTTSGWRTQERRCPGRAVRPRTGAAAQPGLHWRGGRTEGACRVKRVSDRSRRQPPSFNRSRGITRALSPTRCRGRSARIAHGTGVCRSDRSPVRAPARDSPSSLSGAGPRPPRATARRGERRCRTHWSRSIRQSRLLASRCTAARTRTLRGRSSGTPFRHRDRSTRSSRERAVTSPACPRHRR